MMWGLVREHTYVSSGIRVKKKRLGGWNAHDASVESTYLVNGDI